MPLTLDEIDALLTFLERQWMPAKVQQAYDSLIEERQRRQAADARLSDLEQRLRTAAAQNRPAPRAPNEDLGPV